MGYSLSLQGVCKLLVCSYLLLIRCKGVSINHMCKRDSQLWLLSLVSITVFRLEILLAIVTCRCMCVWRRGAVVVVVVVFGKGNI